ncbi:hypothetical protein [Epilithonimonas hungarica]|nr:hypothetical protein [Epilithonimonas hungarica]
MVQYGRLRPSNSTGVNKEYQISHYEAAEEFGNAFEEYRRVCKVL